MDGTAGKNQSEQHLEGSTNNVTRLEFITTFVIRKSILRENNSSPTHLLLFANSSPAIR